MRLLEIAPIKHLTKYNTLRLFIIIVNVRWTYSVYNSRCRNC